MELCRKCRRGKINITQLLHWAISILITQDGHVTSMRLFHAAL